VSHSSILWFPVLGNEVLLSVPWLEVSRRGRQSLNELRVAGSNGKWKGGGKPEAMQFIK
jgi:hypothetical protein